MIIWLFVLDWFATSLFDLGLRGLFLLAWIRLLVDFIVLCLSVLCLTLCLFLFSVVILLYFGLFTWLDCASLFGYLVGLCGSCLFGDLLNEVVPLFCLLVCWLT